MFVADLRAAQGCRVHLSHLILRQHCRGAVGWPHHLQDAQELRLPAGHEVSLCVCIFVCMHACECTGRILFRRVAFAYISVKCCCLTFVLAGIGFSFLACLPRQLWQPSCPIVLVWTLPLGCTHSSKTHTNTHFTILLPGGAHFLLLSSPFSSAILWCLQDYVVVLCFPVQSPNLCVRRDP